MNLSQLATRAARAAARLRADNGIGSAQAMCPFDLADQLGIVVRLAALSSVEGMYSPAPKPTIVVSVERPLGRRRYTCGHELGHHVFGHGTRLDELVEDVAVAWSPEEFIAQRFAAALLMPKLAVEAAFARRGWSVVEPTPESVFVIAQDLGVGYSTLTGHLERTLRVLPSSIADGLRRASLPRLRSRLAGFEVEHDLVVADEHWGGRSIDVEVGDVVLLPKRSEFQGTCATLRVQPTRHLQGVAPGVGGVTLVPNRPPVAVRVSRRRFTGLAPYRHLEETTDEW